MYIAFTSRYIVLNSIDMYHRWTNSTSSQLDTITKASHWNKSCLVRNQCINSNSPYRCKQTTTSMQTWLGISFQRDVRQASPGWSFWHASRRNFNCGITPTNYKNSSVPLDFPWPSSNRWLRHFRQAFNIPPRWGRIQLQLQYIDKLRYLFFRCPALITYMLRKDILHILNQVIPKSFVIAAHPLQLSLHRLKLQKLSP